MAQIDGEGSGQDGDVTQGESETPVEDNQSQVWGAAMTAGRSPKCTCQQGMARVATHLLQGMARVATYLLQG